MYRTTGRLRTEEILNGAGSEPSGRRELGHDRQLDGSGELHDNGELHARRGLRSLAEAARAQARAEQAACGSRILVRDIMSRPVATTTCARLEEALLIAQEGETEVLLVVQGRVLVGVLAPWDAGDVPPSTLVGRVMSAARAVKAEATIAEAASILVASATPCLPVVARGTVVGIVTRRDLRIAGIPKDDLEAPVPFEELGAGD